MPKTKKSVEVSKEETTVEQSTKVAVPRPKDDQPRAEKKTPKRTLTVDVFDIKGNKDGTVALPEAIFGIEPNKSLMLQAVRVYQMNQYQGTALAKTRGQVSGTTKKMRKQKGTGSARHGAMTAPIFVGGGKAHGPQPRDIRLSMPKKMRRVALYSALAQKNKDNGIYVVSGLLDVEQKTRVMAQMLKTVTKGNAKKPARLLLVTPATNAGIVRSVRNIPFVSVDTVAQLHTYEVLQARHILFMREALSSLEETLIGNAKK